MKEPETPNYFGKFHIGIGCLCIVIGGIAMSPLLNRGFFSPTDPGLYAGIVFVIFGIALLYLTEISKGLYKILAIIFASIFVGGLAVIAGLMEIRIFLQTLDVYEEMQVIMEGRLVTFELQTLLAFHIVLCILDFVETLFCIAVIAVTWRSTKRGHFDSA